MNATTCVDANCTWTGQDCVDASMPCADFDGASICGGNSNCVWSGTYCASRNPCTLHSGVDECTDHGCSWSAGECKQSNGLPVWVLPLSIAGGVALLVVAAALVVMKYRPSGNSFSSHAKLDDVEHLRELSVNDVCDSENVVCYEVAAS